MEEQILLRFLSKKYTDEDLIEIDKWTSSDKTNADWLFDMERVWSLRDELRFSDKEEIEKAYNLFRSNLEKNRDKQIVENKKVALPSWIKYVAAIAIVTLLSINVYQYFEKQTSHQELYTTNIIEVPKGQRVSVTLSDGSKVWLNSESKFTYPAQFSTKSRIVKLEGEGYFEVYHNDLPFIVESKDLYVKVLGTKFNVKSYSDETSSVVLKEGKVEVSTPDNENMITLNPNEQVSYSISTGMVFAKNIDAELSESWISGELRFVEVSLGEIMKTLSRKFDIEVVFDDKNLESEIFTCRAQSGASLEQVLSLLKDTRRINYKIENKKVIILKK